MGAECQDQEKLERVIRGKVPGVWCLCLVERHQAKVMWRSDWANVTGRRLLWQRAKIWMMRWRLGLPDIDRFAHLSGTRLKFLLNFQIGLRVIFININQL